MPVTGGIGVIGVNGSGVNVGVSWMIVIVGIGVFVGSGSVCVGMLCAQLDKNANKMITSKINDLIFIFPPYYFNLPSLIIQI
jgi:hypothetical protein